MATFERDFTFDEDIIKTVAKNIRKYRKKCDTGTISSGYRCIS